ncbi:MAG: PAS domain-containing protein [Candidatus Hydrogenedentes bacterium]|nr:PAS domain-containing protein [Candidatus Hydrogenedentota bacterium]
MADDRITDLYEDPSGTLWVAVWGKGVCRIDGTESRTFTSANGLPSDWVRCFAPDADGGLWVGGADGLAHIFGDAIRAYTTVTTPALPSNSIRCSAVLQSGVICFGLASGGVMALGDHPLGLPGHTGAPDEWVFVGYPEIPSPEGVDDVMQAADGSIWLAMHDGSVFQFNEGVWREHGPDQGLTATVNSLYQDSAGRIWGAGGEVLALHSANRWEFIDTIATPVRVVAESESGDVLVGTDRGVWALDAAGWRKLDMGPDIGDPEVSALLCGNTGTPWVGTREGLVRGTVPIWATHARTGDGIPIRATPLFADLDVPPLSADSEGNLIRFEDGQWSATAPVQHDRFRPKWFSTPRDGLIWALCDLDAISFRVDTGDVVEVAPIPPGMQTIRVEWGLDDKPWLLGSKGIFILEGGKWQPLRRHADTRESWAYDIDIANDSTAYVCYESGINIWKDGQVRPLRPFAHLPQGGHFTAVRCMSDGKVWFGTYGNGIVVYDGNATTHITRSNGLVSDHVSQIFEASDGTVWVAYRRKGVSSFKDGRWIYFGHRHGLPNASGVTFAEHPAGTIWLASDRSGILRYAPEQSAPDTTVTAATETIAAGGTGIFSFSGTDAWHRTLPRDIAYSWRVIAPSGPETPWGPVQTSSVAVVSGLPAGEYQLEVRATDEDRNFDATPSVFSVIVEPPFYARLGFVIPVSTLIALVLASLISLYLKQRRLQDSERSLRKSEASLGEAQRIALVGNWEWNVTRNTMVCSPQVSRILGWPSVRRTPAVSDIRDTIHPEDLTTLDDAVREALATGAPLDFDHRILRPDGDERFIHQRGELTKDSLTGDVIIRGILQDITERKRIQTERERLIAELRDALAHIKTLRGLIPICSSCKRIRDDSGYWNQLETFIKARSEAEFSHAICPDCAKQIYGIDYLADEPGADEGKDT